MYSVNHQFQLVQTIQYQQTQQYPFTMTIMKSNCAPITEHQMGNLWGFE